MKRFSCLLLTVLLLLPALIGCSSTDPFSENGLSLLYGEDAAKLLLANARLNEALLKTEGDIFENGSAVMRKLADKAISNLGIEVQSASPTSLRLLSNSEAPVAAQPVNSLGEEKNNIGTMAIQGDTVVWTRLDEVSNSYEYFLNLTNNIVSEAERSADLIDFVKKHIRIVDKWVDWGQEKYFLHVGENEELLCQITGSGAEQTLRLCRRTRNEAGKDVYEMYSSSGSSYEVRITYVPGERYEISSERNQHFVASNTKGYWENYVVGDMGTHYNVSYLIMKNDICYTFGFREDESFDPVIDILSSDRQTDLINYSASSHQSTFFLKLNGWQLEKITAPKAQVEFSSDGKVGYASWDDEVKIHTKNGSVITLGDTYAQGLIQVEGILVTYMSYGYSAELYLTIQADPEHALQLFRQFILDTGLTCKRNLDTVLTATKKALADSEIIFDYYQWNGYTVNTKEGIRAACQAESRRYDEIFAYYTAIKDLEVVVYNHENPEANEFLISFAPLVKNDAVGGKTSRNSITVNRLTLTVNDTTLFVKNEPYHVALALEDSSGALVHLDIGEAPTGTAYQGEKSFTVSSGPITAALPCLSEGAYRVVAYLATSEGIRSSQYGAVAFESAESEPVSFGHTDLSFTKDEKGFLTLHYTRLTHVTVQLQSNQALNYEQFKQLLCETAFQYGTPAESQIEILQGDSFVPLAEGSAIESGTYRIPYTVDTGSGSFQGTLTALYQPKAS